MLARPLRAPQVRSVIAGSKSKFANMIRITHRDEVEAPITDWLCEAYKLQDVLAAKSAARRSKTRTSRAPKRKVSSPARSAIARGSRPRPGASPRRR